MSELVYRVQDREGRGPWRPGFSHRWVEDRPELDGLAPIYLEEGFNDAILTRGFTAYGVGCRALDQLRRWFTRSEYEKLCMFGYQAVSMMVDQVFFDSPTQCLFGRIFPLNFDATPVDLYPVEVNP